MSELVSRFCPSCGARVKAPTEAFSKPAKCPKCSKVVAFHDHPHASPVITDVPSGGDRKEPFDYAIRVCLFAAPVLALIGFAMMLFGKHDFAVLASTTCLVASFLLFAKFSHLKSSLAKASAAHLEQMNLAKVRTKDLEEAVHRYSDFKTNFDRLVQDRYDKMADHFEKEEKRLAKKGDNAQRKLNIANERNGTIDRLGKRLLGDTVKWVSSRMTPNNFTASSDRLRKAVDFCRKHEYEVELVYEKELLDSLRSEFEDVLRKQHAKEEQARIKSRIREEQRAEKELDRELQRIASEKDAIQKALDAALKKTHDEHSEEVELLRKKLQDAEEKSQRAISMAQKTRAGHVYVISNIGSFGDSVFKVGMTRRLEPLDRVKELGDASVPFPFDVHMMISCDDAPALETAIHKSLHTKRLNKVNLRREFFKTSLKEITNLVEANHGEVEYVAEPEALQYRESMEMSDEDFDFVSKTVESLSLGDEEGFVED